MRGCSERERERSAGDTLSCHIVREECTGTIYTTN